MKKCLLLIPFYLFLTTGLTAQLGFTAAPTQSVANEWQVLVENYITGRQTDFLKYGNTSS